MPVPSVTIKKLGLSRPWPYSCSPSAAVVASFSTAMGQPRRLASSSPIGTPSKWGTLASRQQRPSAFTSPGIATPTASGLGVSESTVPRNRVQNLFGARVQARGRRRRPHDLAAIDDACLDGRPSEINSYEHLLRFSALRCPWNGRACGPWSTVDE